MSTGFYILVCTLSFLLIFWYMYVLVMGLYRAYLSGRLKGLTLYLSYPAVITGYLVDLLANYTVFTVVFLEIPHRPLELVTDRLTRYLDDELTTHWRYKLSLSICSNLLDLFDPSDDHCSRNSNDKT